MVIKPKLKLPKKVRPKSITVHIDHTNKEHFITVFAKEEVKTSTGKEDICRTFKKKYLIQYHGVKANGLNNPIELTFTDAEMKTLLLFLRHHNPNLTIHIDYYEKNNSSNIEKHNMSRESVYFKNGKQTIVIQDVYPDHELYRPYSKWWGTYEWISYEDYQGVEV